MTVTAGPMATTTAPPIPAPKRRTAYGRGGGSGGEGNANFTAWVKNTCTVVSDATSGVSDLYDCAP